MRAAWWLVLAGVGGLAGCEVDGKGGDSGTTTTTESDTDTDADTDTAGTSTAETGLTAPTGDTGTPCVPQNWYYDGDGDVTEGIKGEIDTLAEALYAEVSAYAETKSALPLVYDSHSHPYFFVDADKNGEADKDDKGANVRYNAFTPRLLRAAFNYQYVQKDPGAFVHNPKYIVQILIDSIEDLGGDVTKYTRPEAPAPQ